jgi:predicted dehydrogenase
MTSRRKFVKHTGLVAAASTLPIPILQSRRQMDRISVAVMGVRSRGKALARTFAAATNCRVACICEVDERYVADCLKEVAVYQEEVPKVEKDIRKVCEDPTIDAIVIAAPDHWHAPATIMACQAGKHVYLEKPCSHNPQEGEWLVEAAAKYQRVVQMGNQRRSWSNVIRCMDDIRSGLIGRVYYARAWYANQRGSIGKGKKADAPRELDWDLWQGPAPRKSYYDNIHPYEWHWFWHWGTGEALNNGTHFLDLMRWGLQVEYPTLVTSQGGRYHFDDDWQTPDTQVISLDFPGNKTMTWESRSCNTLRAFDQSAGVTFHGEGGSIVLSSGNAYRVFDNDRDPKLIKEVKADEGRENDPQNTVGPGMMLDIGHIENFLNAIREGEQVRSDILGGHQSVLLCQLGNIAYRTRTALEVDPENGHILNNASAMKLWGREYEPGWEIEV